MISYYCQCVCVCVCVMSSKLSESFSFRNANIGKWDINMCGGYQAKYQEQTTRQLFLSLTSCCTPQFTASLDRQTPMFPPEILYRKVLAALKETCSGVTKSKLKSCSASQNPRGWKALHRDMNEFLNGSTGSPYPDCFSNRTRLVACSWHLEVVKPPQGQW